MSVVQRIHVSRLLNLPEKVSQPLRGEQVTFQSDESQLRVRAMARAWLPTTVMSISDSFVDTLDLQRPSSESNLVLGEWLGRLRIEWQLQHQRQP